MQRRMTRNLFRKIVVIDFLIASNGYGYDANPKLFASSAAIFAAMRAFWSSVELPPSAQESFLFSDRFGHSYYHQ